MPQLTTLGFLIKRNEQNQISEICLGMKKTGFGQGKWNGFGGKVGDKPEFASETIEESLQREALEEFGIQILEFKKVGFLHFVYQSTEKPVKEVDTHVFLVENWSGNIVETEEMQPKWFKINQIPFENMWIDDSYWMAKLLKEEDFTASFSFQDNQLLEFEFLEPDLF
jgi:8-oxo-dGTP pyrophosphatase MutT (NUDIX family)